MANFQILNILQRILFELTLLHTPVVEKSLIIPGYQFYILILQSQGYLPLFPVEFLEKLIEFQELTTRQETLINDMDKLLGLYRKYLF